MRVAIVLAAGASRRMGPSPKLELPLGHSTVLGASVSNFLAAGFDRILVVTAPSAGHALPDDQRIAVVENPDYREGMASSIRAGIEAVDPDTVSVGITLGDMPLIRPDTIRSLMDVFERERAPILYPTYRGEPGHPVFWRSELFGALATLAGDRGAREIVERHREQAREIPVDDPGVRFDIDTPRDYSQAKARAE